MTVPPLPLAHAADSGLIFCVCMTRPEGRKLNIVVLGGGRVGSAIVRDLAAEDDFEVLVVDLDPVAVENMTEFGADGVVADLSDPETVSKAVKDADLVVESS